MYATYLIPSSRVEGLQKLITKLANRITKGKTSADYLPEVEATKEVIMLDDGKLIRYSGGQHDSSDAKLRSYTWVTIKYQQPIINGWKLVAVYDWETTEDGVRTCYVSPVPGEMVLPEHRDVEDGHCDHCHTNRRRKKLMLLTKNYLEYQIVGSTCVKDFLGHHNPNTLIDIFSFEQSLEGYSREYYGINEPVALHSVDTVLAITAMFIRTDGYHAASDWDNNPTKYAVNSYLTSSERYWVGYRQSTQPNDFDVKMAENAIQWISDQSDSQDYFDTLKKCIDAGAVSERRFGVLCSAVYSYQRDVERRETESRKDAKSNNWIGEPKLRLKGLEATVTRVRITEGFYGTTTIINLETATGDTIVWFASGHHDVEEHEAWKFDATIKKQDEYRGTRQTIVTRVKYTVTNPELEQAVA